MGHIHRMTLWVSHGNGCVTRRPWCLSCSHRLDQGRDAVTPFGG